MGYNVSKLAGYILKNHKSDMNMLDCTNMIELVNALKDEAVAQTAIMVFDLKESDFLTDSPPAQAQEVLKVIPSQKDVKIPNIFVKKDVKKPILIDTYQALEVYMATNSLLKFDESDKIELVGNFLHTSLFDSTTEIGKKDHYVSVNGEFTDEAEWITKGGHKPSDGNLFSGYKETSHINKAKSKAFNLIGHVFNLIVTALFMLKTAKHICEGYGDNAPDLFSKLLKIAKKLVNSQWESLEVSEKNWLSLNIWQELFTLTKNKEGSHNLYKTYSNCLWVGTGNNTSYQPDNVSSEFFNDLESDNEPAVTKPAPPAFVAPDNTDEVIKILADNDRVKIGYQCKTQADLKELRGLTHDLNAELNSLPAKYKPVDDIKIIEKWLAN